MNERDVDGPLAALLADPDLHDTDTVFCVDCGMKGRRDADGQPAAVLDGSGVGLDPLRARFGAWAVIPAPRDPRADADRFYGTDARADRDELAALIAKHDGNIMAAFRAIMAMPKAQQDRLLAQADA